MATRLANNPDVEDGVYYPSSDGKPMAETDFHVMAIRLLLDALDDVFASRDDVYVAGNVNWFWEQAQNKRRRAPDVMVVFGVDKGPRRSFRSWREGGAVPAVCFEMASERTWKKNLGEVKHDYEANGVREYFIFDPTHEYLESPLVGFRRRGGKLSKIRPDENGAMTSLELGLCLIPERRMIRLIDVATGQRVLTREEQAAVSRAEAAVTRSQAETLAAEVARLKALLKAAGKSANGAH